MKIKKISAVFLSIIMTISSVACSSKSNQSSQVDHFDHSEEITNDSKMEGTNSIGKYVSKLSMEDKNEKAETLKNYSGDAVIESLDFDADTKTATILSNQDIKCTVSVKIINEETNTVETKKEKTILNGENILTEIQLDTFNLPDYYYVTADLYGAFNEKLCPTFTLDYYTREMQEIRNTDIYDFEPEYVVNFDDDETTNFLVLSNDTVIADSSYEVNTLLSADYDKNEYVFENVDETISSLSVGEYFFTYAGENDAIAIVVDEIERDGNIVTIKGNSDNIDDMFAFMKFETTADTSDAIINTENADESVGEYSLVCSDNTESDDICYPNTHEMLNFPALKMENSPTILSDDALEYQRGMTISFPVEYKVGAVEINAKAEMKFTLNFNFYKRLKYTNINVSLECKQTFSVNASVKAETPDTIAIPLGEINIPTNILGCYMNLNPKFVFKITGKAEISVNYSIKSGLKLSYDSDTDKKPKFTSYNSGPEGDVSFSAKVTIFVGIDLDPKVVVLSKALASLTFEAQAGLKATAELSTNIHVDTDNGSVNSNIIVTDTTGNTVHSCNMCIKGKIDFVIESKAKLKVLVANFEVTGPNFTIPMGDFYWSDTIGFGWGTCPNLAYRTTFNILDASGNAVIGAEINVDGVTIRTNNSGNATCFCTDDTYSYTVSKGEMYADGEFTIHKGGKSITLQLASNGGLIYDSINEIVVPITTTVVTQPPVITTETIPVVDPKQIIIESGYLGENIHYIIYADGFMEVYGYGEMDDSGYHYENAALVNEVVVENDDTNVITSIGAYSFAGLENMTTIQLPDTIERIGYNAFEGCSSLKTFTSPEQVKTIESWAFNECSNLSDIVLSKNTTFLGSYAFSNCKSLTKVVIPGNVKTIEGYIFYFCDNLKEVIIKDGVENIGEWIFDGCPKLEKITVPFAGHSIEEVEAGEGGYFADSWFYNFDYEEGQAYDRGVPYTLRSVTVTGGSCIPPYAFSDLKTVTEINLPKTIKTIYNNAFDGCESLPDLNFIHSGVEYIGDYAFKGCSDAKTATVPDGVKELGEGAFSNCVNLVHIAMPDTLVIISDSAFDNCNSLATISIPKNVTTLGSYVFSNCDSLNKVTVPGNVNSIGGYAFYYCDNLKEVVIEDGVEHIGEWIFDGCPNLESITIPFAGHTAGDVAANDTSSLEDTWFYNFDYEEGQAYGRGVPYTLKSITVTGGSCIPSYAFSELSGVTEIKIYGGATTIHNNAFKGCSSLTSISLSENISFIDSEAFLECTSLAEIKIYNPNAKIMDSGNVIPSTTVIYGYNNSSAEKYASKYKRKFISLGDYLTEASMLGDCNLDGKVTAEDLVALQDYLLGRSGFSRESWLNADMDSDGTVDVFDMCFLRRYFVNS